MSRPSALSPLSLSPPRGLTRLVGVGFGQAVAVGAAAFASRGLMPPSDGRATAGMIGVLVAAAIAGSLLRGRERLEAEILGQRVVHRLRSRMFRHLLRVSPGYMLRRRRGAAIVRFVGDLQAIRRWVSLGLARLVVSGTTLLGCLGVLLWVAPLLAAAVAIVVSFLLVAMFLLAAPLARSNRVVRRSRGTLANVVTEQVTAHAITHVHGRARGERRRLERRSERLADALIARAGWLGRLDSLTYGATALVTIALILLGARSGMGDAAPSTVVATLVVVALLSPSLRDLARVFEYLQSVRVAIERLESFFDWPQPRRRRDAPDLRNPRGAIEYRGVRLSGRVRSFDARVEPHERIALLGSNGAGKSSLLALTAGLLEPGPGEVLLGGQRIDEVDLDSLHRHVAIISPELPLVRGSLRRNLLYHVEAREAAALDEVVEMCGLGGLIARLGGLDARILEGGRNLSQGERQRIALARALMAKPSVLLLDEVDAHLDRHAMEVLAHVIRKFDGIVIAATHDLALLGELDRSIDLDAVDARTQKRHCTVPHAASVLSSARP